VRRRINATEGSARLPEVTIEYSLTKGEIVRSYFRGLISSPRFLFTIVVQSIWIGLVGLVVSGVFTRKITWRDGLTVVAWASGYLVFLPCWLFIRGKTGKRTLTISPAGIDTQIGTQAGTIPWSKVRLVKDAGDLVLIARAGGNSFLIPDRAFSGNENRRQFLA
jgi:hypothetical protein